MKKNIFIALYFFLELHFVYSQDTINNKPKGAISFNTNYIYFNTPYSGFFKNNELFNLQGIGNYITYIHPIRKNEHFYFGATLGYEKYKMLFYNMDYNDSHYYDEKWNKTQYSLGDKLVSYFMYNEYAISTGRNLGIDDSLIMYFGKRNYYFDYLNFMYKLGYKNNFGKKIRLNFDINFYFLIPLYEEKIKKVNDIYYYRISSQTNLYPGFIYYIFPFYPIYSLYGLLTKKFYTNGFIDYNFCAYYSINRWSSLGFNISIANISPLGLRNLQKITNISYTYNRTCTGQGCAYSPPTKEYGPLGTWNFELNPTMYLKYSVGINYTLMFK